VDFEKSLLGAILYKRNEPKKDIFTVSL